MKFETVEELVKEFAKGNMSMDEYLKEYNRIVTEEHERFSKADDERR